LQAEIELLGLHPLTEGDTDTAQCSCSAAQQVAINVNPILTESFFIAQDGPLSHSDRAASQPSVIGTNFVPQGCRRRYNKNGDPGSRR
jgi:hypothetical protein